MDLLWQAAIDQLGQAKIDDLQPFVELAETDKAFRQALVVGLQSKEDTFRYNCFRSALTLAERKPGLLYPEWQRFVEMLASSNAYQRTIAEQMLARLSAVDSERRFDALVERYFSLLNDESLVVARFLAQSAGIVALHRPDLQEKITTRLLAVNELKHTQKELIKTDVLAAFDQYYDQSHDQERMRFFAEGQLASSSPKTKKAAKEFLSKHT
jgi:hypothetical protein